MNNVLMGFLFLIIAGPMCIAAHEGGHYIAARITGERIKFRIEWIWHLPRFVWYMPITDVITQKIIAVAGFATELLSVMLFFHVHGLLGYALLTMTLFHFVAYPFYAGSNNDFKFLV